MTHKLFTNPIKATIAGGRKQQTFGQHLISQMRMQGLQEAHGVTYTKRVRAPHTERPEPVMEVAPKAVPTVPREGAYKPRMPEVNEPLGIPTEQPSSSLQQVAAVPPVSEKPKVSPKPKRLTAAEKAELTPGQLLHRKRFGKKVRLKPKGKKYAD